MDIQILLANSERWNDLEALFGAHGAFGGCWCMWWRLKRSDWNENKGEGNHQLLKNIVDEGQVPGLLAYADGAPVGWISLGRREVFPSLDRTRFARRIDDRPVWSVVCFFVARKFRRKGVAQALLKGAIDYARSQGAEILEGYPVEVVKVTPDPWIYTGVAAAFRKAGFKTVAREGETRPLMRYYME